MSCSCYETPDGERVECQFCYDEREEAYAIGDAALAARDRVMTENERLRAENARLRALADETVRKVKAMAKRVGFDPVDQAWICDPIEAVLSEGPATEGSNGE